MKEHQRQTLIAVAWGMGMIFSATSAAALYINNMPHLAIPLLLSIAFCGLGLRVAMHDRRIAKAKESWRQKPTQQWQYENIINRL